MSAILHRYNHTSIDATTVVDQVEQLTIGPSGVGKVESRVNFLLDVPRTVRHDPRDTGQHWQAPSEEADLSTTLLRHVGRVEDEETEC